MADMPPSSNPIPIAPATPSELYQQYGIIAVLLPSGLAALEGFDQLVEQIIIAPGRHKALVDHHCIFLYSLEKRSLDDILEKGSALFLPDKTTGPTREQHDEKLDSSFDDLASASDTTCGSVSSVPKTQELWHGFLAISLRHQSQTPRFGWSIGYQPYLKELKEDTLDRDPPDIPLMNRDPPDIPLCSEQRGQSAGIHRRHVTLNFASGTANLGIRALRNGLRPKCDTATVQATKAYPLLSEKHHIDFGKLQYWIIYVQVDDKTRSAKEDETADYIQNIPDGPPLVRSASATPTREDHFVGNWKILAEIGRGSSTIMSTVIHKETAALAVARHTQENDRKYNNFRNELRMEEWTTRELSTRRYGRCHIQRLLGCVPSAGDLYAFYQPFCPYDLGTVLSAKENYSDSERQVLFTQLILAIQDLHAIGKIHRDIKTSNIRVQSRKPLCIVLIDTASIRKCPDRGLNCTPGVGGTVGFLAPEQEREAPATYGKPVDIWAAGCVGVDLLLRKTRFANRYLTVRGSGDDVYNPWRDRSSYTRHPGLPGAEDFDQVKENFYKFRAELEKYAVGSKEHLLHQMLDPDPRGRITAHNAATHPFIRGGLEGASVASEPSRRGKRKASQR